MSPQQPPRLLDQVRKTIRLKHFSLSTEKSYVYYIHDYILFHDKRHPKGMGVPEIRVEVNQWGPVIEISTGKLVIQPEQGEQMSILVKRL
ncbi:MAG: phage integrase N-terminal SAM-like domain-containing protein [Cyanobacteria bacterium P01_D01_bin.1]